MTIIWNICGVFGTIGGALVVAICIWQAVDEPKRRTWRIVEAAMWLAVTWFNAWSLLR